MTVFRLTARMSADWTRPERVRSSCRLKNPLVSKSNVGEEEELTVLYLRTIILLNYRLVSQRVATMRVASQNSIRKTICCLLPNVRSRSRRQKSQLLEIRPSICAPSVKNAKYVPSNCNFVIHSKFLHSCYKSRNFVDRASGGGGGGYIIWNTLLP